MQLFIANCTKQHYELHYRLPEVPGVRMQRVSAGQQIQIAGDLSTPQVDAIISHFTNQYGMADIASIDRAKPFVGLCCSIGKPIKVDVIGRALEHNDTVLTERGREIRQTVAVALNNSIAKQMQESQLPDRLGELEMEAIEVDKRGVAVEGGVQEGVTVSQNAPTDSIKTSTRRMSGRQRRH